MLLNTARKFIVAIIGGTVVLVGVVLVFTPGPAFIVIPAGLAILATEFVWAARLLKRMKARTQSIMDTMFSQKASTKPDGHSKNPAPANSEPDVASPRH